MTHTHWHSPSLFRWLELCAWTLAVSGAIAFFTASVDVQKTREGLGAYVTDLGRTVLRLNKRAQSPPAAVHVSAEPQRMVVEGGAASAARSHRQTTIHHGPPTKRHDRGKATNPPKWTRPSGTGAADAPPQ